MGVHESGHAFGLVLLNSNALEVEFNEGIMIIRAQGGVFDFYLMVGDSPSDVIKQYHTMIGTPFMPPYWAYGYQLSKWGYQDLEEVKTVVDRTRALGIPFEMQYIDIGMGLTSDKLANKGSFLTQPQPEVGNLTVSKNLIKIIWKELLILQ